MSETKKDIIRLSCSAGLLVAAIVITNIFDFKHVINAAIFILPYLIAAFEVLKEALISIFKGEVFDENFLMSIASLGAFIVGEYPEAVFVMLFFGIGELFEDIATKKSRRSVKALLDIRPDTATLINNGNEETVLSKEISVGDIIKIMPGERIPLDGVIIKGSTTTDNSAVTGESLPISAEKGDLVFGGCVNLSGTVEVKVTKNYGESTASKILSLVEESADKKAKSEKFITKFAKIYTPMVCLAAVLLAVIPSFIFGNARVYIYRALTFLVVSCPCALVVSVPLTYFAGIASAAKKGILIKGAQYLETLTKLSHVLFDKTGTLTKGNFEVIAVHPEKISEHELLRIAAAAESGSRHPISLSLKLAYGKMEKTEINELKEISGEGVEALIDGVKTIVGNAKIMKRHGIEYHDCEKSGTIVHVAQEHEYLGHIVIGDTIKSDAKSTVFSLKKHGIKTVMLTGDRESAAKEIAEKSQIDEFFFELKPEDKVSTLEKYLKPKSHVAFVGDGINDAPVLSRADIGVAMGALGSDAAVEAADVVLMEDNVSSLVTAIKSARRTQRIAKENIIFSLFVKFLILILCSLGIGITNMWMASFGDVGVLIIVVLNSLRAIR